MVAVSRGIQSGVHCVHAALLGVLIAGLSVACGASVADRPVTTGDMRVGRAALADYGCVACHTIPGVPGSQGHVGPPLERFGLRAYIAGSLPNGEANLVRWITDPQDVEPGTAMPDLGVDEDVAADMAAYLLSLE